MNYFLINPSTGNKIFFQNILQNVRIF